MVRFFLLLLIASSTNAVGQIVKQPSVPDNIEIVLNTEGDLRLDGGPAGAVTTNKAQNQTNDKLVKQFSEAKETKVFTTKAEAKNGKKHDPLAIAIPDGSLVTLRTQTGNVTLDNVNASVSGYVQSGNISLNNLKGEVELVSEKGHITAAGVEARGMLIARDGDIQLTDVTGLVSTHAPQGKISLSVGKDYYKKRPEPLDISLPEGDIEIATAPFGGKVQLGKGKLTISDVTQTLIIDAEAANIILQGIAAPLRLRNRGNVTVQLVKFADRSSKDQTVDIETINGNVVLELTEGFAGIVVFVAVEVDPAVEQTPVFIGLEKTAKPIVTQNINDGSGLVIRENTHTMQVGKESGVKVRVRVINGTITIR